MEYFWRLLRILDWLYYWRFNVCAWSGVGAALLALVWLPSAWPSWVVAGAIFLAGIIAGMRWESNHPRS